MSYMYVMYTWIHRYPAFLLTAEEEELCGVQNAYAYKWVHVCEYVHTYVIYIHVMYRCIHRIPGALAGVGGGGVARRGIGRVASHCPRQKENS